MHKILAIVCLEEFVFVVFFLLIKFVFMPRLKYYKQAGFRKMHNKMIFTISSRQWEIYAPIILNVLLTSLMFDSFRVWKSFLYTIGINIGEKRCFNVFIPQYLLFPLCECIPLKLFFWIDFVKKIADYIQWTAISDPHRALGALV